LKAIGGKKKKEKEEKKKKGGKKTGTEAGARTIFQMSEWAGGSMFGGDESIGTPPSPRDFSWADLGEPARYNASVGFPLCQFNWECPPPPQRAQRLAELSTFRPARPNCISPSLQCFFKGCEVQVRL